MVFDIINLANVLGMHKDFIWCGYSFEQKESDNEFDKWLKAHYNKLKEIGCIK